jgi:hypothetical protein
MRVVKWLMVFTLLLLAAGCARRQPVAPPEPEAASPRAPDVAIRDLGGEVQLETGSARVNLRNSTDPVAGLKEVRRLGKVRSLDLSSTVVTDESLEQLTGLTSLEELLLNGTEVGDAGVKHLEGLSGLRKLDLAETRLTAVGVGSLKGLINLRELNLALTGTGDAGLVRLRDLTELRSLNLHDARIVGSGLDSLAGMKHLKTLRLDSNSGLTEKALVHLEKLTALETLYLSSMSISDAGLARLRKLTNLRELYLYDIPVSDRQLEELRAALPRLKVIR